MARRPPEALRLTGDCGGSRPGFSRARPLLLALLLLAVSGCAEGSGGSPSGATGPRITPDPRRLENSVEGCVADPTTLPPLDLVFVLDISTTMDELADLRGAILHLFELAPKSGLDVRMGLTSFGNDVVVHGDGAFLDRASFTRELDSQLLDGGPNPDLPRQLLNFDYPENILDALYRAATRFDFRPGARRYLLLMTDDTFREPPEVFSDGTPATFSYREVSEQLRDSGVRLFSVHDSRKGRGLSSSYRGEPSLVEATDGMWFDLEAVESGALDLDALLVDLASGPRCP